MKTMTGKAFEQRFKQACDEQGVLIIRLRDAGYQGEQTSQRRFTIKNVADCIVFDGTKFVVCELKHRKSSLAFKDISQYKDIKKINDFIESNGMHNATAGLLVCFGSMDKIYWVHIAMIDELKHMTSKKSFNFKDCQKLELDHPLMCMKVDAIIPPRKRTQRIDTSFIGDAI